MLYNIIEGEIKVGVIILPLLLINSMYRLSIHAVLFDRLNHGFNILRLSIIHSRIRKYNETAILPYVFYEFLTLFLH